MDKYESMGGSAPVDQSSMRMFTGWVLLSQVLGLTTVILVGVWMGNFRGGFAWTEDPAKEFNYHPLFMIIGLVFLYSDAMLVYRVFRNDKKIFVKVLHTAMHVLSLIFVAIGLKTVFDSHNLVKPNPIPNLYSLHSWLGILTVSLFCLQWFAGLCSFLLPIMPVDLRRRYKPLHVYWGILIFVLAIGTALTGMTEKALFSNKGYNQYNPEGILINCLGLVLVTLAAVVVYIVTNPDYARQPLPEETEHVQLDGN